MKRAVLYLRVSTLDQTTANQERERVRFKVMRYAADSRIEGGLAYGGGETERRGVFGNS
jgi:DNA invertase Pin-like site-specific DNA recombinase